MPEFSLTNIFTKNLDAFQDPVKRIAVNQGGTSSSKTHSILQLLIDMAKFRTKPLLISVVSESLPHLRKGAIRDFKKIMGNMFVESKWSATQFSYEFSPNVLMEFFSADQPSKAAGPRRDILFCNEVNNIPKSIFDQLDVRTRRFVFVDFNPTSEFYIYELKDRPEVAWIHSTYLDAKMYLDPSLVANIESRRERDPNWWNIYGLGQTGNVEGLVHPSFQQIDALPEFGKVIYGLDFGYTNDPSCLIKNVIVADSLFSDEVFYEKGLSNHQIAKRMEDAGVRKGFDIIIADSAEPKSIDEIYGYGYNIHPAVKGRDSIRNGIQAVNSYRQHWTKRSLNCIKEQRNYRYLKDKEGKYLNDPIDDWNHGMDSRRMVVASVVQEAIPQAVIQHKNEIMGTEFTISFNKIGEYSTLVCSQWHEDSQKSSIMLALWNAQTVKLYVFASYVFDNSSPDMIMKALSRAVKAISGDVLTNLNTFQWYGSPSMFTKDKNDLCYAYGRYGQNIQENANYDEAGAILLLERLLQREAVYIHDRCEPLIRELQQWTIDKGKPGADYGLCRALIYAVSCLWETGRIDPPHKMKPYGRERTEFNRVFGDLLKREDHERYTDEQIAAMAEVSGRDKPMDTGDRMAMW